jgi:peptide/nickel transport system substrate-binding protein
MHRSAHKISRRRFLSLAAAATGGALLHRASPAFAQTPPLVSSVSLRPLTARAGVIRVGWESVKRLDPAFASSDSEISFLTAVYDYLVDVTTTDAVAPRLAQSWQISEDGRQYTFKLVPNAKFHDGSALTAEDVIYSFNRLRDPAVGSPKISLFDNLENIGAPDDLTVVFTLRTTEPDFIYSITDNSAVIVRAGARNFDTEFIGTGPFKVERYIPEDRTIFVANEDYWQSGLPYAAGMEHRYLDSNAAIEALRGGELDVVLRMPNARFIALQNDPNLQTVTFPTSGHDALRLRMDSPPGNDPRVRKALKMATNREEINAFAQLGLGSQGRDAPIGEFFAEYFDPESPLPPYDPDGARALLAEAGYPDLTFELFVPNTGTRPDFAVVIKDQWAKAGITVNINLVDEATYYGDDGWLEVQLGITGWGARPSPQQYLDFSLKSDGKWNESRIADPELDALIVKAGTSVDRAERIAAYKAIQRKLAEDGPLIIPYFFPTVGAARKEWQFEGGFAVQAFPGRTNFSRARQA